MKESELIKKISDYLKSIPDLFFWKEHGGMYGTAGIPDIIICYRGRFIGLECKVGKNKPTMLQSLTIRRILQAGGYAMIVRTVEEVKQLISAFEQEELTGTVPPVRDIKKEVETYLQYIADRTRGYYFRVKYYDEGIDRMLMLFLYKGERFGPMQVWKITGVCFAEDWTEELEENGQIRFWLKTKISDFEDKTDWVVRVWQEEQDKAREDYNDNT